MLRTHEHKNVEEFSKYLNVPIINGLTNLSHPCQIMSDIMTFEELKGPIKNKKIAWLGDGNNITYSLIEAAVQFNFELRIASPKGCEPKKNILQWAKKNNGKILVTKDPIKAASKDAIFMHCLPASRGEEVTNDVIDGKQSVVWLETLNRIHAQKSIIEWCLK